MGSRGAKPGERRGGRKKGTPNVATIERQLFKQKIMEAVDPADLPSVSVDRTRAIALAERRAEAAARAVQEARHSGTPLAKDALNTFMGLFMARAGHYAPKPDKSTRAETNEHANEDQFERWAKLAVDAARILAPFQSPTLRAMLIQPPQPEVSESRSKRFTLKVFDHTNGSNREIEAVADVDEDDL